MSALKPAAESAVMMPEDAAEVERERAALAAALHPSGIPSLWCPPIVHYREGGAHDTSRMRAHWGAIMEYSPCILVPGTTGDGWEMDESETAMLLKEAAPIAKSKGGALLLGALRPDAQSTIATIGSSMDLLAGTSWRSADSAGRLQACLDAGITGFAICAPRGADRTEAEIRASLERVLELGLPAALYQLPQMTKNEISPATLEYLASRHPNFYLFKDTSGGDKVALSEIDRHGVFFVRGAEGDFSQWTASEPGSEAAGREHAYDGFLLSSANVFAAGLASMLSDLRAGRKSLADEMSNRISSVQKKVLEAAAPILFGNAFSHAARAMDHCVAFGSGALDPALPAPLTHSGNRLPRSLVEFAFHTLAEAGFDLPSYMD